MFDSMKNLSVRLVEPEDDLLLYDLFVSVRGAEVAQANITDQQKDEFLRFQFEAMHNTYADNFPDGIHHIVIRKKKEIGRIYTNSTHEEIRILDVIIHPKWRNKRVGSQLMEAMIEESEKTGKTLRFYVWTTNSAAQRFYKRHGCEMVEDVQGYLLFERLPQTSSR